MRRAGVVLLFVLALAQMVGDLAGWRALRGLAAATGASPAPRVFSASRGLETYSTRFALEWRTPSNEVERLELTPAAASALRGPYNRRNVYGAILAYGPVLVSDELTRPMFASVAEHALVRPGTVLHELGVDLATVVPPVRIVYTPVEGTDLGELPTVIEVPLR